MAADIIDFGNGITAHSTTSANEPFLELGHRGFDVPEFDVPVTEHGVSDGGTIGTSRANARHMRATVWHDGKWTRREIAQAFTPNVQRTIVTPLGSMPYYVEALEFPESLIEAENRFSVSLVSPLAYPLGPLLSKSATSLTYTTTDYNAAGTEAALTNIDPYGNPNYCDTGTSFMVSAGQTLVSCGLYIKGGTAAESKSIRVWETVGEDRFAVLLAWSNIATSPSIPGFHYHDVAVNKTFSASTQVTCTVHISSPTAFKYIAQPEGAYPNRSIVTKWWDYGVGSVTVAGSMRMRDTRGASTTNSTEAYLTTDTELPCHPKVTVTLAASAAALTISDGTRTATITGTMASGAVVVLDSAARTVTVNGTNRIAWFDRTGDWPLLYPGVSRLTTSVTGTIAVEWRPRMMGLI